MKRRTHDRDCSKPIVFRSDTSLLWNVLDACLIPYKFLSERTTFPNFDSQPGGNFMNTS
ncbi:unnamed protein product [Ectocarpus sp. CCAP 1310/34]|nr:unnamed protein product [Ectocarpus sp. CCAP 1310/34]